MIQIELSNIIIADIYNNEFANGRIKYSSIAFEIEDEIYQKGNLPKDKATKKAQYERDKKRLYDNRIFDDEYAEQISEEDIAYEDKFKAALNRKLKSELIKDKYYYEIAKIDHTNHISIVDQSSYSGDKLPTIELYQQRPKINNLFIYGYDKHSINNEDDENKYVQDFIDKAVLDLESRGININDIRLQQYAAMHFVITTANILRNKRILELRSDNDYLTEDKPSDNIFWQYKLYFKKYINNFDKHLIEYYYNNGNKLNIDKRCFEQYKIFERTHTIIDDN